MRTLIAQELEANKGGEDTYEYEPVRWSDLHYWEGVKMIGGFLKDLILGARYEVPPRSW